MDERIGVLLVHGIGEQKRFQHLENEARCIVDSLFRRYGAKNVSVTVRSTLDSAYLAEQPIWRADGVAPVRVEVDRDSKGKSVIEFREVWWADLDERDSFGSNLRFWLWALGQWSRSGDSSDAAGLDTSLNERPKSPHVRARDRAKLAYVSAFFFVVFVTWTLAKQIFTRLLRGRLPNQTLLANYLGDVKLMVQPKDGKNAEIGDAGLPPRVGIRRRMIRSLVEMALDDYDRWYVIAHSLGTVVAQNGLNETELCLPNYLDEDLWKRCRQPENGATPLAVTVESEAGEIMMPRRPFWLEKHDAIDRSRLFGRLAGVLTYGSPLDKFATLWPWIVRTNPDPAFREGFRWFNVHDATDPVAGSLDAFGTCKDQEREGGLVTPYPENAHYHASLILLLSHIMYFPSGTRAEGRLADHVVGWLLDRTELPTDRPPTKPDDGSKGQEPTAESAGQTSHASEQSGKSPPKPFVKAPAPPGYKLRAAWRVAQWGLALAGLAVAGGASLSWAMGLDPPGLLCNAMRMVMFANGPCVGIAQTPEVALWLVTLAALVTLVVGSVRWIWLAFQKR